jgi:hypothetical protein
VISGFRRAVDEKCALLGYYAASSGNFLPTFWDNLPVLSSGVKNSRETDSCPEMPVKHYDYSLWNNPEERRFRLGFESRQKQKFLSSYVQSSLGHSQARIQQVDKPKGDNYLTT